MAVVRAVLGVDTQDVAFLAVRDAGATQTEELSVEPRVRPVVEIVNPRGECALAAHSRMAWASKSEPAGSRPVGSLCSLTECLLSG